MPSVSPAQHRWIEWIAHNPAALAHSGMTQAKAQEWAHSDKGSPWKHHASGGAMLRRGVQPDNDLQREILERGWHSYMGAERTGDADVDSNMQTTAPLSFDANEVWRGPHSGLGQRTTIAPDPQQTARGGTIHRDTGGMVDPTSPALGGFTPSPQTMNPMTQGLIQRYSSLPTEKLQELSAQLGASPQGQIIQRVLQQKRAMPQQGMQPAQQQSSGMQQPPGYAVGGSPMGISMSMADPPWTRQEESSLGRASTGFLNGDTAGRADSIKTQAPSGAYVLPADVVAGLGEGNSLAGARVVQSMLSTGPHGIPMPRGGGRSTIPRPPPLSDLREFAAKGGGVQDDGGDVTPVALSHGEVVITPQQVAALGGGDLKRGHRILDHFIVHVRKKNIDTLKKLPGPVGMKKAT